MTVHDTVKPDLSQPGLAEYLNQAVDSLPGLNGGFIASLSGGKHICAGDTDEAVIQKALALFSDKPRSAPGLPAWTDDEVWECLLEFRRHWVLSCREPAVNRLFISVQPTDSGFSSCVDGLQKLVSAGDSAPSSGAGAGIIVRGDAVKLSGKLPDGALGALLDTDRLPELMRSLYGLGDEAEAAKALDELVGGDDIFRGLQLAGRFGRIGCKRLRFAPDVLIVLQGASHISPLQMEQAMSGLGDNILRQLIDDLLDGDLNIPDTDLPETDQGFNRIIEELRKLPEDDLHNRLIVGGFANHSLGDQGEMEDGEMVLRCKECIYYLPHRKWCDLPELPLPVEPEWYCRLWKL